MQQPPVNAHTPVFKLEGHVRYRQLQAELYKLLLLLLVACIVCCYVWPVAAMRAMRALQALLKLLAKHV